MMMLKWHLCIGAVVIDIFYHPGQQAIVQLVYCTVKAGAFLFIKHGFDMSNAIKISTLVFQDA